MGAGRAELVAGILLSAQWSVVRAVATRGASGDLAGPADWASQPGSRARLASLLTSVDASLKWQPVKRRHKCERNFGDFRHK